MSKPTDTPETDAHFDTKHGPNYNGWVPAIFARRMERERDEARAELQALRAAVIRLRVAKGRYHTQLATETLFELIP